MQKVIFKFLIISVISLIVEPISIQAKTPESELITADSLYQNKQFTEAIKIYNNLFEAGFSSPNMLLKMSRVMEGQENWGLTIFYLEKYFQLTHDQQVITHIEKLVEENKLSGFQYELPYYANLYYKHYRNYLSLLFVAILMAIMLKTLLNLKKKSSTTGKAVLIIVLLIILGCFNNFNGFQYGITINPPTYSMKGPSAGADIYKVLDKSTKIILHKEVDIWTKSSLNDKETYIRTDDIKKL